MGERNLVRRALPVGALGVVVLVAPMKGNGEPERAKDRPACASAFKAAKELEEGSHLRRAKEMLLSCAKPSCGALLRQQCASHYAQLEADIPSVVPLVTDESGEPRVDVQVSM